MYKCEDCFSAVVTGVREYESEYCLKLFYPGLRKKPSCMGIFSGKEKNEIKKREESRSKHGRHGRKTEIERQEMRGGETDRQKQYYFPCLSLNSPLFTICFPFVFLKLVLGF
jgi:hypothetical protein